MKYKCLKCNKEFSQKSNYDAHINRKIPCVVINEVNINSTNLPQNSTNLPQNSTNLPQNTANLSPILTVGINANSDINININKCIYCLKLYSRKDALLRHKNTCKQKNNYESENIKLKEEIIKLKEENAELKTNFVKVYKEIDDLKQYTNFNQVSKPKNTKKNNQIHNQTHTETHNQSHNTQIHTNSNNNTHFQTNNFMLNFGNENISKVSEAEILDALKSYPYTLLKYVKAVNLNERIPENQTVLVKNAKIETGSIVEDNKLVVKNKNKIIEELIQNRLPEIKKFAQEYKNNNKISRKEYDFVMSSINFLETNFFEAEDVDGNIVKSDKDTTKRLKEIYKELLYQFYDHRKMVSDNIKKLLVDQLVEPIMNILDEKE
jgi:hypothetical protein